MAVLAPLIFWTGGWGVRSHHNHRKNPSLHQNKHSKHSGTVVACRVSRETKKALYVEKTVKRSEKPSSSRLVVNVYVVFQPTSTASVAAMTMTASQFFMV